jgi:hypothetical protein
MLVAAETIGYGGTLVFIGGILLFFTVLAALAECVEKADEIRRRNKARAEARATRREEKEQSDAQEWEFSWQ